MTKTAQGQEVPVKAVGSSSFGRYAKISSEKTYNMFESENWLVNYSGYKVAAQIKPSGEGRGIFRSIRGNFMLVVVNSEVWQLNSALGAILIGNLASNTSEVFMDENLNSQICIVDGVNAYIYNWSLPPNLTIQKDNGGPGPLFDGSLIPNYVTYHNTYFLFGNGNSTSNGAAWYAYGFDTPTTIIKISQLALQTKPDHAIAILRIPAQSANVLVFGTSVCEIHTQIGGLQNYRRVNSISVDYGCISVSTIAASDNFIMWLAVNAENAPVIMVYAGQAATPVSTDGIDYVMGTLKRPDKSTALFSRVDGHLFYQITFFDPQDNLTLAFDFESKKFFHLSDQYLDYHPARQYAYFNQQTYFCSLNNGSIYVIDTDITVIDENVPGQAVDQNLIYDMQRVRITDNMIQPGSDRFVVSRLTLTIEQGQDPEVTGLSLNNVTYIVTEEGDLVLSEWGAPLVTEESWGGQSSYTMPYQPRVDLSISKDSGITWSNTVGRGLNPVGYRQNILHWDSLGACNSVTFKFRFWGRARFVVGSCVMEIRE